MARGCGSMQNHLLKAHPVSEGNGKLAKVSGKLGDYGVQDTLRCHLGWGDSRLN